MFQMLLIYMYKWVNFLNLDVVKPKIIQSKPLYESDDEVFFERLNRVNICKLLYYQMWYQMYIIPPPPYYIPYLPQGR